MDESTIPTLSLFVRPAFTSHSSKSACLICQQWFMVFHLMAEKNIVNVRVIPVSHDNEPHEYTALNASKRLPAASIASMNMSASTTDDLENLIEKFACPSLTLASNSKLVAAAEKSSADVYKNMLIYMRTDNSKPLLSSLQKVEDFLFNNTCSFLVDDEPCYPDCMLMPKLQHLRVLLRAHKEWDIPSSFVHTWRYISRMYETPSFVVSCPTDADILMHYQNKYPLPKHLRPGQMGVDRLCSCPPEYNTPTNGK